MVNLSDWDKTQIAILMARLARVELGEVWGRDRPEPYTAEERAKEIAHIKSLLAELEAGNA